ncbi:MAG: cytochrome c [Daejeonella sp.]
MRNKLVYIFLTLLICSSLFYSCNTEDEITYQRYYVNGKGLYEKHCQNCHNIDGKGLANLYPPLTDSIYLKQNKYRLACIIKYGLSGKIKVSNQYFEGQMPANGQLADIDIAQIIVYITNSFGNKQGFYDAKTVNKDLKNCN